MAVIVSSAYRFAKGRLDLFSLLSVYDDDYEVLKVLASGADAKFRKRLALFGPGKRVF